MEEGINLQKNSVLFTKRSLVEKFIQRGDVIIISWCFMKINELKVEPINIYKE